MRFTYVIALFMLMGMSSAQLVGLVGAAKGLAALGTSVAKLASAAIPAGLLLPLAMVGPLRLSLPMLLGAKGLGLLKLKLLMRKTPLLAPISVHPMAIFASARQSKAVVKLARPAVVVTRKPSSYAMHEPEAEEPAYGRMPSTTTTTTTSTTTTSTTRRPVPAYTPAPSAYAPAPPAYTPAPSAHTPTSPPYALKRRAASEQEENLNELPSQDLIVRQGFAFIQHVDGHRCVIRAVCEIAAEPSLAKGYGPVILKFLSDLDDKEDSQWTPYKRAMDNGAQSKSRRICQQKYKMCTMTTEDLVQEALQQVL